MGSVGLLLLILGGAPPTGAGVAGAAAQDIRFARIQGQVRPAAGERVLPAAVEVTLTCRALSFDESVSVSGLGLFEFDHLSDGFYLLEVTTKGYEPVEESVIIAGSLRGETVQVAIALGRPLGDRAREGPKTVEADLLAVPERALKAMEKAQRAADPKEALRHLDAALEAYPDWGRAHTNRGSQLVRLGRIDEAVKAFLRALNADPDDALAHRNLGFVYVSLGQTREGLHHLLKASELDPGDAAVLCKAGELYLVQGQYQLALHFFRRALPRNPGGLTCWSQAAKAALALNDRDEAVRILKEALVIARDDSERDQLKAWLRRLEPDRPTTPDEASRFLQQVN